MGFFDTFSIKRVTGSYWHFSALGSRCNVDSGTLFTEKD